MVVVSLAGSVPNLVPKTGEDRSMNWMAPTKTACAPGSLANAPLERGVVSLFVISALLVDCIVSGKAEATGIGVSSAVAPLIEKLFSVAVSVGTRGAVPTVKVADCDPMPPADSAKVVVPVSFSDGCEAKVKLGGSVTVKRELISNVP